MMNLKKKKKKDFGEIDNYIMNDEKKYLQEDIYIILYPNGNELCLEHLEIHSIINYNSKHTVSLFLVLRVLIFNSKY